jgi:eukaryotic-like serine/threonine-protein kinase
VNASDAGLTALRTQLRDRYAIERLLGRGGMGAVYLARDLQLDRLVALKVLPAEFVSQTDLRARFLQETRTAASFSHPNIVPVFSIEDRDGLLAFSMGYVEGESLADLVKRAGPLSVREAVRMLQDVGYALAYAHGRGVVHRDIKPDNIMIERATGRALVMDFGISRTIASAPVASVTQGLTRVGEVVGTPEFMSPEQASGDTVDGRSDIYALGLVAWFALTGELAIRGETTQKVLVKQLTQAVPPIGERRPDLPASLAGVIDRCVKKEPSERFATAESLVEAVDNTALRGTEIPLPIRLFADELGQVGFLALGSVLVGPLLYVSLKGTEISDLDAVLPMVLFGAVVYARAAQSVQQARRLTVRGFSLVDVQRGFGDLAAEREAEREQLRATPAVVTRRRRQVIAFLSVFVLSMILPRWVRATMATEYAPGMYQVSRPGILILYSAYVMRGISIVSVLRSPLRRPIGEWLFGVFWMGPIGRGLLALFTRGVARPVGTGPTLPSLASRSGVSLSAARVGGGGAARTPPSSSTTPVQTTLEERVEALERWRAGMGA